MEIQRIDHVSINVADLQVAKAFFLEFGLNVIGEWEMDGELLENIVALPDAKVACAALGTRDGEVWIELVHYETPKDERGISEPFANTLGIGHIAFTVDDIEAVVARLKKNGTEVLSEIQNYKGQYKLVYCRGPEGIILELAEKLT
ncbi:VOC family protein [Planococcus sp. FY231025]|uniref:VOC family protein n=1 Tax=Planococcus sp. FY231025 TaxID=3455699 RepID=UPI003F91AC66